MFSLCRNNLALVCISIFILCSCATQNKKSGVIEVSTTSKSFTICSEPNNLPMSQQSSRSGFEVEVAQIISKQLGRNLEIKWIPQRDQSYIRQTIGAGECDAIMGVPQGFERLLTTKPWYKSEFVFITRAGTKISSLDDPRLRSMKIGVPMTGLGDTPPVLALGKRNLQQSMHPYSIFDNKEMIEAVSSGSLDAAIVWGPFAYFASQSKQPLEVSIVPNQDKEISFSFPFTIGVKKGNQELKQELDAAIDARRNEIAGVLNKWRIPFEKTL